jgi:hypothetical protein
MNDHCAECGMACLPGDYHPYAACVMYRQCRQSEKVESWLKQIMDYGAKQAIAALEAQPAQPPHPPGIPAIMDVQRVCSQPAQPESVKETLEQWFLDRFAFAYSDGVTYAVLLDVLRKLDEARK